MSSNKNNGLMTKIWGPSGWEFLHSVSFGYPIEPTAEQKKIIKIFFIVLVIFYLVDFVESHIKILLKII